MNIGLQPQYPIIWTLDVIFGCLILIGTAIQILAELRTRKKAKVEFETDHADWEKSKDVALAQQQSGETYVYLPREPTFQMHQRLLEPAPVGLWIAVGAGILGFCTLLATIIIGVPFNSKYYNNYVFTGTVQEVVSSVVVGSDSVTSQFTVKLSSSRIPFGVDDPRIKVLQGQQVSLVCAEGWNNQAADDWNCSLRDYAGSTR